MRVMFVIFRYFFSNIDRYLPDSAAAHKAAIFMSPCNSESSHRYRVFENGEVRRIIGPRKGEIRVEKIL